MSAKISKVQKTSFFLALFCLSSFASIFCHLDATKIVVIGAGYLGLVSASSLASMGNMVTCVDIDQKKIDALNHGNIPIYEPNLNDMIIRNVEEKRLSFSVHAGEAIENAHIVLIVVGTPMNEFGKADLSALDAALIMIAAHVTNYKVICIKSTVPPGINAAAQKTLKKLCGHENFDLVSNPEFLREGSAFTDFFEKNPIILGGDSSAALDRMEKIYRPLLDKGRVIIRTNFATAELIKYAWNAFSAIKISYVNELSQFCTKMDVCIKDLVWGMSFSDDLLPMRDINPGPGIGGSCLPKDTCAFVSFAKEMGIDLKIVEASIQSDSCHKQKVLTTLYGLMNNNPEQKTVAILGLSFRPDTDDIRNSPALVIIQKLLADGVRVKAYDPQAMDSMKKLFPDVIYCETAYQAVEEADVLLLLTEWNEFKALDLGRIAGLMKQYVVMDTRNIWDPALLNNSDSAYKKFKSAT